MFYKTNFQQLKFLLQYILWNWDNLAFCLVNQFIEIWLP